MCEYRHPVSLITKGALILRDLDLLSDLARDQLCSVTISLTTLSNDLKRRMEPRTAAPATRLKMIERLREAAAQAGAEQAGWIMIHLPYELDELFQDWLQRHFPDRARHVMNRIRDLRGGKSYDSTFGSRMTGQGPYSDLIRQRFRNKVRKLGLNGREQRTLRTDLFRRPAGDQMALW
ncbi:hypothetical protein [Marinobacter sp.]|uniref:hypothetical protein n=1 Tax=Marinobacter sp. TaxID=50741 RepID=UPI003567DC49